jgi:RNA polymerase sigma factor (sigma-70 family)
LNMLTLYELRRMITVPEDGEVIPTAKQLKESEIALIKKKLGKDVEISVYQCGYAIYQVCSHSTVFPVHLCGDYLYACDGSIIHLPEIFFEKEKWYLRLMLEGEDRLNRNQEMKERNVSYSNVSEEWESMKDTTESVLERLLRHETVEEMLQILTEKQKIVVQRYFLQEKTQLQISKELGISRVAVRDTLLRAVCKIRKKYQLSSYQSDCRVECGVKE